MLRVSTRKYVWSIEPALPGLSSRASESAVSRRFVSATRDRLAQMMSADHGNLSLSALMTDGIHVGEHLALVALASTRTAKTYPWSLRGNDRNTTASKEHFGSTFQGARAAAEGLSCSRSSPSRRALLGTCAASASRPTCRSARPLEDRRTGKDVCLLDDWVRRASLRREPRTSSGERLAGSHGFSALLWSPRERRKTVSRARQKRAFHRRGSLRAPRS